MIGAVFAFILIPMCSTLLSASKSIFIPEIPDDCKNANICDFIPNYPNKEMEKIIKELNQKGIHPNKLDLGEPDIHTAFLPANIPNYLPGPIEPSTSKIPFPNNTVFHSMIPTDGEKVDNVTFDVEDQEVNLCRTVISTKYPKAARDKNDKWYFVVNNDQDPYQAFHVELCASDAVDKPCGNDNLQVTFQSGYESRCIQKYIWRYVLAVNQTGHLFKFNAEMPSCCSCIAKSLFN